MHASISTVADDGSENFTGGMMLALIGVPILGVIAGMVLGTGGWFPGTIVVLTLVGVVGLYFYHAVLEPPDQKRARQVKSAAALAELEAGRTAKYQSKFITGNGWSIEAPTADRVNKSFPSGRLTVFLTNTGPTSSSMIVRAFCCSIEGTRVGELMGVTSGLPPGRREMVVLVGTPTIRAHRTEWVVTRHRS
jgi:hypothetical protein